MNPYCKFEYLLQFPIPQPIIKMDWGNFDILVALSASYPGGRLTDIHWCSFDLRHKTIGFEASLLINDEGEDLS